MIQAPVEARARGLSPLEPRQADLATLTRETWDVVIVGGGIVGAGALLSRQRLEVDAYLAGARREFSVPPPGAPRPADGHSASVD